MSKLSTINNTFESYQKIIDFFEANKAKMFSDIHLEIHNFFAANMSASLGAILDKFTSNLNDIHFDYISPKVEAILLKNY